MNTDGLFQTAWNVPGIHDPARAINDHDVFCFDPLDCTKEAQDMANRRAATLFADLECTVDARNQARVHLWYAKEFGTGGYPRLTKTTDGIDNFLAVCCMVRIRRTPQGGIALHAPFGVGDILSLAMRPNSWFPRAPCAAYELKAQRWRTLWPELTVEPAAS